MPVTDDFSFRRAVSAARVRDYELSPAMMSSKESPDAIPPPNPSFRLATTLIPIYTSEPPQSAATHAASLVSNTFLASTPTTFLEPVFIPPLASKYFPQATNPLWVPSPDEVPGAWKPSFEQNEAREEIKVRLMLVGLFILPIVFVVGGSVVRSCWHACWGDDWEAGRQLSKVEIEHIEEEEREMEIREGKKRWRWFT